jgi:hypothetical protein
MHLGGVVAAVVVAQDRHDRCGGAGVEQQLQHGDEPGGVAAGKQAPEGAGGQVQGAEQGGAPVFARGQHLVAVPP